MGLCARAVQPRRVCAHDMECVCWENFDGGAFKLFFCNFFWKENERHWYVLCTYQSEVIECETHCTQMDQFWSPMSSHVPCINLFSSFCVSRQAYITSVGRSVAAIMKASSWHPLPTVGKTSELSKMSRRQACSWRWAEEEHGWEDKRALEDEQKRHMIGKALENALKWSLGNRFKTGCDGV